MTKTSRAKGAIVLSLAAALAVGAFPAAAYAEDAPVVDAPVIDPMAQPADPGAEAPGQLEKVAKGEKGKPADDEWCDLRNAVDAGEVSISGKVGVALTPVVVPVELKGNVEKQAVYYIDPAPQDGLTIAEAVKDGNIFELTIAGTPTVAGTTTHDLAICTPASTVIATVVVNIAAADPAPAATDPKKELAHTGAADTLGLGALALLLVGAGVVAQQTARRRLGSKA